MVTLVQLVIRDKNDGRRSHRRTIRRRNYSTKVGERLRLVRRQKRMSLQEVEAESGHEFKASVLEHTNVVKNEPYPCHDYPGSLFDSTKCPSANYYGDSGADESANQHGSTGHHRPRPSRTSTRSRSSSTRKIPHHDSGPTAVNSTAHHSPSDETTSEPSHASSIPA